MVLDPDDDVVRLHAVARGFARRKVPAVLPILLCFKAAHNPNDETGSRPGVDRNALFQTVSQWFGESSTDDLPVV